MLGFNFLPFRDTPTHSSAGGTGGVTGVSMEGAGVLRLELKQELEVDSTGDKAETVAVAVFTTWLNLTWYIARLLPTAVASKTFLFRSALLLGSRSSGKRGGALCVPIQYQNTLRASLSCW